MSMVADPPVIDADVLKVGVIVVPSMPTVLPVPLYGLSIDSGPPDVWLVLTPWRPNPCEAADRLPVVAEIRSLFEALYRPPFTPLL